MRMAAVVTHSNRTNTEILTPFFSKLPLRNFTETTASPYRLSPIYSLHSIE